MKETILLTDGYKLGHHFQYPEGTEMVYSNWTPRSCKYFPEQPEWLRRGIAAGSIEIVKDKVAIIDTAGGSIAFPGDYIIFGYGRIYTRHPEIFEKHFEKAE